MMRKLAIFSIMLLTLFVNTSYADLVRDACYATSSCGAKTSLQSITATVGSGVGALAGFASPVPGGMILGGVGGYLVGKELGGQMSKAYNANEYIYFDDGKCIECDNHNMSENYECPNGTLVSNGGAILKCHTSFTGDRWTEERLYPCPDSLIQDLGAKGTVFEIKAQIEKPVSSGVVVFSGDACFMITCGNGGIYDKSKKECIVDTRTQEQKDCESVKDKQGTKWDAKNNKCLCPDGKNWDKSKRICFVPVKPDDKKVKNFECPKEDIEWLKETKLKYFNDSNMLKLIDELLELCTNENNRSQMDYDTKILKIKMLIKQYENDANNKKITDTEKNIKYVADRINGVTKDFNKSVWKTTEGEFNKTRLLSDSVAGVVLGTAGGLITSSVIKKNQTDNGFDDISCTVGGQVVSGWGDEFTVGIR